MEDLQETVESSEYLKEAVGKYLSEALCEVAVRRPDRPIEFLAYYLISLYEKDQELQQAKETKGVLKEFIKMEPTETPKVEKPESEETPEMDLIPPQSATITMLMSAQSPSQATLTSPLSKMSMSESKTSSSHLLSEEKVQARPRSRAKSIVQWEEVTEEVLQDVASRDSRAGSFQGDSDFPRRGRLETEYLKSRGSIAGGTKLRFLERGLRDVPEEHWSRESLDRAVRSREGSLETKSQSSSDSSVSSSTSGTPES